MVMPDPTATAAQRAGVADGIALWNAAAATRLSVGGGSTDAQPPAPPIPTVPLHFQSAAGAFYGLYEPAVGQIFINVDLGGHPLAVTIAHEIGHAFGLVHIPASQRASLMNSGNLVTEPTPADVATLDAHWGETCTTESGSGP